MSFELVHSPAQSAEQYTDLNRRTNPNSFDLPYGGIEESYINEASGLPNRHAFDEAINYAVENHPGKFSVLALDFDGLKGINDELGHKEGDRFIRFATGAVRDLTRHEDALAIHISGDEMWVLLPGVTTQEETTSVINRIQPELEEIGAPCSMGGRPHIPGESSQDLRTAADKLLEINKNLRKFYGHTPEQRIAALQIATIALEADLDMRAVPGIIKGAAIVAERGYTIEDGTKIYHVF